MSTYDHSEDDYDEQDDHCGPNGDHSSFNQIPHSESSDLDYASDSDSDAAVRDTDRDSPALSSMRKGKGKDKEPPTSPVSSQGPIKTLRRLARNRSRRIRRHKSKSLRRDSSDSSKSRESSVSRGSSTHSISSYLNRFGGKRGNGESWLTAFKAEKTFSKEPAKVPKMFTEVEEAPKLFLDVSEFGEGLELGILDWSSPVPKA
jgi:hypothetical protein